MKARVCPTSDGPASATSAPPVSSQPAVRSGGPSEAVRHDDAEAEQHQRGAEQLVGDEAGVERRHHVGQLEALAVDHGHRDLQDRAERAEPRGVRRSRRSRRRTSVPVHERGRTRATNSARPAASSSPTTVITVTTSRSTVTTADEVSGSGGAVTDALGAPTEKVSAPEIGWPSPERTFHDTT